MAKDEQVNLSNIYILKNGNVWVNKDTAFYRWTSNNWIRANGNYAEAYLTKNGCLYIECFPGAPGDSFIYIGSSKISHLIEMAKKHCPFSEYYDPLNYSRVEYYDVEIEKKLTIADWLCSLFCQYVRARFWQVTRPKGVKK